MDTGLHATVKLNEQQDFGIGREVSRKLQRRFLNRDGSFNVHRRGFDWLRSRTLYHLMLSLSWPRFLLAIAASYVVLNVIFACLYLSCGTGALKWASSQESLGAYWDAFFFSIHTFATVGYGDKLPVGLPANLIVVLETIVSLLSVAVATGFMFARFSRPNAKIRFSDHAIVAPYMGGTGLMFRLVNERSNQLVDIQVRVILTFDRTNGQEGKLSFYSLELERSKITFFPLHWTVVHPINEQSPLWNMTQEEFLRSEPELLVMVVAVDDTFSQSVYSWSSYIGEEILWGAKFKSIIESRLDGTVEIDVNKLNDVEMVS